jgi:K(+)-stimulated pyrophosphate-energized sodium pump
MIADGDGRMNGLVLVGLSSGVIGIFMAVFFYYIILKQPLGTERMIEVWKAIREGASAYMKRQIKTIIIFSLIIAVIAALSVYIGYRVKLLKVYPELHHEVVLESVMVGVSVIFGALASLIAAFFSMDASTKANIRTTAAAMKSSYHALRMTLIGGSVLGFSVPSLSLFFISLLYLIYYKVVGGAVDNPLSLRIVLDSLAGFAFGASLSALFAQLGGGIYTKAADIGADLVGKVEASIPEDDPRNPAVIADQVGDNVGDCAGRGADIFESVTAETLGAMMIGWAMFFFLTHSGIATSQAIKFMFLPLAVASIRIIASIPGIAWGIFQKKFTDPFQPMRNAVIVASATAIVLLYFIFKIVVPDVWYNLFIAAVTGIIAGALMVIVTNWYTGLNAKPVVEIAEHSKSGVALTILSGLSVGMSATLLPVVIISIAILVSFISGMYMHLPLATGTSIGALNVSRFIYGVYGTAMANGDAFACSDNNDVRWSWTNSR